MSNTHVSPSHFMPFFCFFCPYSILHGVLRICSGYYFVLNFWISPTFNPPVLIEWCPKCTCWIFESVPSTDRGVRMMSWVVLFNLWISPLFFWAVLFAGLWWFAEGTILRWNVESLPLFFAGSLRGVQLSIIFESLRFSFFFLAVLFAGFWRVAEGTLWCWICFGWYGCEIESEWECVKEKHRLIDRQIDRQTNKETERQRDGQTDGKQTDRQTDRQIDR